MVSWRLAMCEGTRHHARRWRVLPCLPEVLMDERAHLLERLLGRRRGEIAQQTFALPLKDGHVDLATRLAVLSDELLEVRARMPLLVLAGQAQRRRQCHPLPTGQGAGRGPLGHGLFRLPVLVMHGHHTVGEPGGWGAILA